jgi:hypothetical protein
MKTYKLLYAVPLGAVLFFSSCATSKVASFQQQLETKVSKEPTERPFVKFTDGRIEEFKSLEIRRGAFIAPHLVADGSRKIKTSDIVAYQTADHFAIDQNQLSGGRKSLVSVDALPGFAIRVAKGKLNLYCKKFYNGNAAVKEYFIQQGAEGKIYVYSPEVFQLMIENNPEALGVFNNNDKSVAFEQKLMQIADIVNKTSDNMLVSAN